MSLKETPGSRPASPSTQKSLRGRANRRTVRRVLQTFGPYKGRVTLVLLAIVAASMLNQVLPLTLTQVFDDALAHHHPGRLLIYAGIMIGATLLSSLIGVAQTYLSNTVGQRVMRDFRSKLYAHLQDLSLHFFTSTRTGEIQSRLSNDISNIQTSVTDTFANALSNFVNILGTLAAMIYISPLLTLVSFLLLPPLLFFSFKVGNTGRTFVKATQQSLAALNALMQETLSISGILLIKTFGRKEFARDQFEIENENLTRLSIRQRMVGRWFFMFMGAFSLIIPVILLTVTGWSVIYDPCFAHITIGDLFAFIALQDRFYGPINQLLTVQVSVQSSLAIFDRIFEYLDIPIEIQDAPDAIHLTPDKAKGEVRFTSVSFTYKQPMFPSLSSSVEDVSQQKSKPSDSSLAVVETAPVALQQPPRGVTLRNLSFHIQPGQLVALVGPSGAGKTTITYLISRLYDPDQGTVEIDGHSVKEIAAASRSKLTGVVTQDTYLFHTSIRQNLLYVRPDAPEEELFAATKAAAIHERILELEHGYETVVGERGYRLSGGEKQRLAIARVLLTNPRILILDEATSSLDTHSERLIQEALKRLMKGRTTIAIAHRLSTILAADLILVVDKGEIVERGTHQELLEHNGLYAMLYNQQFISQLQERTIA